MDGQRSSLLGVVLGLAVAACSSGSKELACPEGPCGAPAPQAPGPPVHPAPPVLPAPPVISSDGCVHAPTVEWQGADFTNEEVFELPCVTERLDARGCVGDRVVHTFDAAGRVVRARRWLFDPSVLPPLYVVPTSQITTYAYDAQGRLRRTEEDADADGDLDRVHAYAYDERGRVVAEVVDDEGGQTRTERSFDDADRVISESTLQAGSLRQVTRRYRDDGQLLSEYVDVDGARAFVREATYDDRGRPLMERSAWVPEGSAETTEYAYDALGLALRVWTRADAPHPSLVERHRFERWPDGALRREVYDQLVGETRVSRHAETEYDAAGRELSTLNDDDLDGGFDSGRRYTYDAEGRRVTEYTFNGARVLRDVRRAFDAQGRVIEEADHVRGTVVRTTFAPRTVTVTTFDFSDRARSTTQTTYDDAEREVLVESDTDGDGRVDQRFERSWTASGALLRARGDRDGDGAWDFDYQRRYDLAGQGLYSMEDDDGDGAAEHTDLVSYACQLGLE